MTRHEKRRRMRRMLAGLFAGAAVLVPTAPAAVGHDDPADRAAQPAVIAHDDPADRVAQSNLSSSLSGQAALVRPDGPDGSVASIQLRRDGNAAVAHKSYTTSAPASGGGSEFDWTASGIGAASAALLLLLGFAGLRVVSRHGMAQA